MIRRLHRRTRSSRGTTLVETAPADPFALFALSHSATLDTSKAHQAGYSFAPLEAWIGPLIGEIAAG